MYDKFTEIMVGSCEGGILMRIQTCLLISVLINNTEFRDWLKNEKFDLAFTHMYTFCPIGIIYDVSFTNYGTSKV